LLANLSRKLQVSMTYFWGKWFLPIPRDEKVGLILKSGTFEAALMLWKLQRP
jgi:hypothetical protein